MTTRAFKKISLCALMVFLLHSSHLLAQRQIGYAKELQSENRLPEWANYVCYEDAINSGSGWFMLMGYEAPGEDPFFKSEKEARSFGYKRTLTFQEYLGSADNIMPMNMPISPERFASELDDGMKSGRMSVEAIVFLRTQFVIADNIAAIVKHLWKEAGELHLDRSTLKDEEGQALLDFPDGTNYHTFVDAHPGYIATLVHRQKYYDAGILEPSGGFKRYREGNILAENTFGSDVFETVSASDQESNSKALATRIQMFFTPSDLRFLKSATIGSAGIGIPVSGKCDHFISTATKPMK